MRLIDFCGEPDRCYECKMALFTRKDDRANNCLIVSEFKLIPGANLPFGYRFLEKMTVGYYGNPRILVYDSIDKLPIKEQIAAIEWDKHHVHSFLGDKVCLSLNSSRDTIIVLDQLDDVLSKTIVLQFWWRRCNLRRRCKRQAQLKVFITGTHLRLGADS